MSGEGTDMEMWSVISMRSPALKLRLIPPAAFVRNSTFAPMSFISRTGSTTSWGLYPS